MQAEHGKDFDKDYASLMTDDHKEDIEEFNKASQQVKDPDIKAFAIKTIPVLEKHLNSIQAINSAIKK